MDDIVVIILTLVVAVFGALNQRRKKRAEAGSSVSSDKKQGQNFWEMLVDNEADMVPAPEQYASEMVTEDEPAPVVKPKYRFESRNEGMQSVKRKTKVAETPKKKKLILGDEFSLKKAIIYSEIINRKYI